MRQLLLPLLIFSVSIPSQAEETDARKYLAQVPRIGLSEAKRLYDEGAVFIDVRDGEDWRLGHIENARHFDFPGTFRDFREVEDIDKETPVVFYCADASCRTAPHASAVSMAWGYEQVFYFSGGYFAWMAADYPLTMPQATDDSSVASRE